jgi:hypothetical protein
MKTVTTINAKATAANAAVVAMGASIIGSSERRTASHEAYNGNHGWRVEGSSSYITTTSAN